MLHTAMTSTGVRNAEFNIFEALNIIQQEIRHSDFLAFLLDPRKPHGLQHSLITGIIGEVITRQQVHSQVNKSTVDRLDAFLDALTTQSQNASSPLIEVSRETHRIDVLLRWKFADGAQYAIIIENKIRTTEHSDQLTRYWSAVQKEYPGWKIIGFYLTPGTEQPSDNRYLPLGYDVIALVLHRLLQQGQFPVRTRTLVEDYHHLLTTYIIPPPDMKEERGGKITSVVYRSFSERIDEVQQILETLFAGHEEFVVWPSKHYFGFRPKEWFVPAIEDTPMWFAFDSRPGNLVLRLIIGDGDRALRQKFLDFAVSHQPPFKCSGTVLNKMNNTIYAKKIMPTYEISIPSDELKRQIQAGWTLFIDQDLPAIITAMKNQSWIWEEPAPAINGRDID